MRRKTLSDAGVANLKPRPKRYAFPDPELGGHFIRVTPTGAKSYCAVARDRITGKQVWATVGGCDLFGIGEAREKARQAIKRIREGRPPFDPPPTPPDSFKAISQTWMKRHVDAKGLRSRSQIERMLRVHVLPVWGDREFTSIRRGDVVALLDHVEDEHGARQADLVLGHVRGIMNWHAARHDDYSVPIVRGMSRTDPKSRKRARILDDDEIRAVWDLAEKSGMYGAIIRICLLTAQRRDQVAAMRWADIVDSEWRMPLEDRAKGVGGALQLPNAALAIIEAQPRMSGNPYVFAGRYKGYFNGWSPCKRRMDAQLAGMAPWVVHDLRRTARSLMSRAGVRPDIAERVMGHVIAGVEGVYDRHSYRQEKADALRKLAALIDTIVHPRENVVPLRA
jgi:integrase